MSHYKTIESKLRVSVTNVFQNDLQVLDELEAGFSHTPIKMPIVGFQGVEGSFSEEAVKDYFKDNLQAVKSYEEFSDVLEAIAKGEVDYGVLPIENSTQGEVLEVYDLMSKYRLYIVGEHTLKIEHDLLAPKGASLETIQKVYSHPQALSQCKQFLREHKQMTTMPYLNTAMAVKYVAQENDVTKAAIGSRRAAGLYGLEVICPHIHTLKNNCTRFIILGKKMEITPKCDKVSIVFTTKHESGALYTVLSHFAYNGVNLLKIHSRPMKDKSWHYFFFVDIEGHVGDANMLIALGRVSDACDYFNVLGNYEASNSLVKEEKNE